jgi:hypothetical protein
MNIQDRFVGFIDSWATRPVLLFLAVSIALSFMFGINVFDHQLYNLTQLMLFKQGVAIDGDLYSFNFSPYNPVFYYLKYIVPLLQYGFIYVVVSILLKLLTLTLLYKLVCQFLNNSYAMVVTLMFIIAYLYPSHGIVPNGLWMAPGIFPAALSGVTSLVAITQFIKKRYFLAGVIFSASIFLHSLYGVTTYAWIFLGMCAVVYQEQDKKKWIHFLASLSPILLAVVYIAYFRLGGTSQVEITHSFSEWFNYLYSTDPDDVTLYYSLREAGFGIVPLFAIASFFSFSSKKKEALDWLVLGSFFMLATCAFIEIIHLQGVFFGGLSEKFIATQFRRGVWIGALLSLIKVAQYLSFKKDQIFNSPIHTMLLSFAILTYIIPSVFSVLAVGLGVLFLKRQKESVILVGIIVSMIALHYFTDRMNLMWQIKLTSYSVFLAFILFLISLKSKWGTELKGPIVHLFSVLIILFSAQGLAKKRLPNSIKGLANNGLFNKTDIPTLNKEINYSRYDKVAEDCMKSVSSNYKTDLMQLPISGVRNTKDSLFSFKQFFDYSNPMYSRTNYQHSVNVLSEVFQSNVKGRTSDWYQESYRDLGQQQLVSLQKKYGLRFYLLKEKRDDLNSILLCKGDEFYVYDIQQLALLN